jgi:hypothetical protein
MIERVESGGLRHRTICYTGCLESFLCFRHYVKITFWDRDGFIYCTHQGLFIQSFIHSLTHSFILSPIHSFRSLPYGSIASSKASSPKSSAFSFNFQYPFVSLRSSAAAYIFLLVFQSFYSFFQ